MPPEYFLNTSFKLDILRDKALREDSQRCLFSLWGQLAEEPIDGRHYFGSATETAACLGVGSNLRHIKTRGCDCVANILHGQLV